MIISDPRVRSLSEHEKAGQCIECIRPRECCRCGRVGNFWKHGSYIRGAWENGQGVEVTIQRFICPACWLTVSILPEFLVPYRHFTVQVIAGGVECYLQEPRSTYRSVAGGLSGDGDSSRPDFSQVWRWVAVFATKAKEQLVAKLQRIAVELGMGNKLQEIWDTAIVELRKARSLEKWQALIAAVLAIALAMLTMGWRESVLVLLQTYLATKVQNPFSIFTGRGVRLWATQRPQQVIF